MAATGGATGGYNKKETVLDLSKFIDKSVRVKLAGGREGTLINRGVQCEAKRGVAFVTVEARSRPEPAKPCFGRGVGATIVAVLSTLGSLQACELRSAADGSDGECTPGPRAGATVTGVLKGYDQLMNLVLDETVEYLRGR
jgi:small nuclear ribonucleoprotein (snRNP)-like protein